MDPLRRTGRWIALLIISLTLSSCVLPHETLDTTNCDPKQREDCYSVAPELLLDLFDARDAQKETRRALNHCQHRL
jgi:hypothetical protein